MDRFPALIWGSIGLLLLLSPFVCAADLSSPTIFVVVGAGGTPEYESQFHEWAGRWQSLSQSVGSAFLSVGLDPDSVEDRQQLKAKLQQQDDATESPLLLILIGHGTDREGVAKFNLRGPDITASELTRWCDSFSRPLVIIQCASCSGAFLLPLSGDNRIVITATQSGAEENFARFGDFFSRVMTEPAADLDHDETISLLEAYLLASDRVANFYEEQNRLATEHPLLDDNGDGLGTPANFFRGIHATKATRDDAALDGLRAHQLTLFTMGDPPKLTVQQTSQRDELEQRIADLRQRKTTLSPNEYYEQLEPLLVQLARLYSANP